VRNQPLLTFDDDWGVNGEPAVEPRSRLLGIGLLFAITLIGIGVRVVWIQTRLANNFIAPWSRLATDERVIDSRDGRILSRDGVVLAQDAVTYDIAVHFRWFESPPNAQWLRTQLRRRLSRDELRDSIRVDAVTSEIARERSELIDNLADAAGVSVEEIEARASQIQRRVERMKADVENRRESRRQHMDSDFGTPSSWGELADRVIRELTTPPDRFADEPVILREELSEHVLLTDVSLEVAARIQSYPHRFRGVTVLSHSRREYPFGDVAAHLIGVRKVEDSATMESHPRRQGISGIERRYNSVLSGSPGLERLSRNRQGELIRTEMTQTPRDGRDVVLSIDSQLQRTAETLLDEAIESPEADSRMRPSGAVLIALDVWTGQVLALAEAPRPASIDLIQPTTERWKQLVNDPRRPLFPRITQAALPAGSIFKVITAMAAVETGTITPDDAIHCRGYLDRTDQYRCLIYRKHGYGHGETRLADALSQSCNVFFFDAARRLGPAPLVEWAERCGFGQPTGIDLPGESSGHLPRPNGSGANGRWFPGSTLQLAVGQGELLVTPLQVVRLMAAIANGGYLVTPQLAIRQSPEADRPRKIPGLGERTLHAIRQGLELAVVDPQGTARGAKIPMLTLAGKTGTAEVAVREDHAWFAGYAPVERPRVAFVVVVEHGGGAGTAAVPVAREFLLEMQERGDLPRE